MESENKLKPLTEDDVDGYVNFSLDSERIRDVVHRAVLFGETDILMEAMAANYEMEKELSSELLGDDCFDVDIAVNQEDDENVIRI